MKHLLLISGILTLSLSVQSQILKRIADRAKNKVEQKIDQKVDKTIDDAVDGKKTPKKKEEGKTGNENNSGESTPAGEGASLKSYGKFDFVPGEKLIVAEDFSQDAVGDFPAKWNTNSTGEVVTVDGRSGRWLSLTKDGVFIPDFITALPENFTLEFDLLCNPSFDYYSTAFHFYLADLKNKKDFHTYKMYGPARREAVEVWVHPKNAGGTIGHTGVKVWEKGSEAMDNHTNTMQFHGKTSNFVKVSVWRQKQRIRVYLNEEKVWDMPRAFSTDAKYNSLLFMTGSFNNTADRYLVSNVRLAVGAPDTRNKLITEGKFVTRGILFDVNSDRIKAQSYGALKDIATVLSENAGVRVKIIGHTDSDGEDLANLDLSKRRAAAVKSALTKEFGIDAARMETDGKGESQPADKNESAEGKANNRRVEFIKL